MTTAIARAYCAEMNCNWSGDIPAVAKCPTCNSSQVRRLDECEGNGGRALKDDSGAGGASANSGTWGWTAVVVEHRNANPSGSLYLQLRPADGKWPTVRAFESESLTVNGCERMIDMHAAVDFGVFLEWRDGKPTVGGLRTRIATQRKAGSL